MVTKLGLQGNSLLIFAMIHNFSKDGKHTYRGSYQYIADWLNISIRSAKEIIANLVDCGYITKRTRSVSGGHPTNEYIANYESLLERVSAGEDVQPSALKRRGKSVVKEGGESAPLSDDNNGGESAPLSVVKDANNGGESAPNKDSGSIINNYFYSSARAREACPLQEEEKKEFTKIFWCKNAANPAAETVRFIETNNSRGWKSASGIKFETPEQRIALAKLWKPQAVDRLKAYGTQADKERGAMINQAFLDTVADLWEYAWTHPDTAFNPLALLHPAASCCIRDDGAVVWRCRYNDVVRWYAVRKDDVMEIFGKRFKKMTSLEVV